MSSFDKFLTKNSKNRQNLAQLSSELIRIEREKHDQLRIHNNEQQRFRAKYSRNLSEKFSDMLPEAYRFNNEDQHQIPTTTNPDVDFENLQKLLFTNGELDIEKILCLHLLSTHKTEYLSPPLGIKNLGCISKRFSPLEQLLERSKKKFRGLSLVIPSYVLDVPKKGKQTSLIEDGRLSARLLINDKIALLIKTVLIALDNSNREKLDQLLNKAKDVDELKRILQKPHLEDFMKSLENNTLITSCDSFTLTQPFRVASTTIDVNSSEILENLITHIRRNVLQLPTKQEMKTTKVESKDEVKNKNVKERKNFDLKISNKQNFIAKNIAEAANYSKYKSKLLFGFDSDKPVILSKSPENTKTTPEVKVNLKQTTCEACMQKWKVPLPSPKVSDLTNKTISSNIYHNYYSKMDNLRQISNMIQEELHSLEMYDKKFLNLVKLHKFTPNYKRNEKKIGNTDVELSLFDLEKIKQEISCKETQKKLNKFLQD